MAQVDWSLISNDTSRDLLVVYVDLNIQPSHVSGVPGASAMCNLKTCNGLQMI